MNNTLNALLRYTKQTEYDASWQGLRDNVFANLYHPKMQFGDVIKVLLKAYEEAVAEPRFELPASRTTLAEIVLAPVQGYHAIEWFGTQSLQTQYTVEQFYTSIIRKILSDLRHTRVYWCKVELTI